MNLAIDVHDPRHDGTDRVDRTAREGFRDAVKDSVRILREQYGIPTLFMAGGQSTVLYPRTIPWSINPPEVRDFKQLEGLRLSGVAPRIDEDIFLKRFPDGFTDIEDARASPELAAYLATDGEGGYGFMDAHYGQPTLRDHLKSLGVQQVTIMGATAEYCVIDSAIGAARSGFQSLIFSDLVVGWADRTFSTITWPKTSSHQNEVGSKLAEIMHDPTMRGFKASDQKALEAIRSVEISTFPEFLSSLDPSNRPINLPSRASAHQVRPS
jgi:hypothetical protein